MVLRDNEYKIIDDGILLPKSVLESWRDHYCKVADECKKQFTKGEDNFKYPFFIGKATVMIDLIKMFDDLEGE